MVPYVKENKLMLDISLDICILFSDIATVDHLLCIRHVCCLPAQCTYSVQLICNLMLLSTELRVNAYFAHALY